MYLNGYQPLAKARLVSGFTFGFHINSFSLSTVTSHKNLKSARMLPNVVESKIAKEVELGRYSGPYHVSPYESSIISPVGVREKKVPGEYRLIHNLSYPYDESSVNASIPREFAQVKYASIDHAVKHILDKGRYCFLAKSDIKSAFRIIPVHPDDRHLLGILWNDCYYYDNCLPMGCSSSCQLFEDFSTALHWIMEQHLPEVDIVHVLDDFLFITNNYDSCLAALETFTMICKDIGVPLAPEKTVGPEQILPFLGIQLDTVSMAYSLPDDKVNKLLTLLEEFLDTKSVTLVKLQSLCGVLNFACGVVAPARAFTRRLYDLTIGVAKPFYKVKITRDVKKDLCVWRDFIKIHNHRTFFLDYIWLSSDHLHLYTDAASTIGFGGVFGHKWFKGLWSSSCLGLNIALLEIYPICLALHLWSHQLSDKCLMIHTDNIAVVSIINTSTSKDPTIMIVVRKLVLICMQFNIMIKACHIAGRLNLISDFISRDQVQKARQVDPLLEQDPIHVPSKWMLDRWLTE